MVRSDFFQPTNDTARCSESMVHQWPALELDSAPRVETQDNSVSGRSHFRASPGLDDNESGQTLVEFALVLIFVVLPLAMVFIESSVLLYKYVALTNAAREGARAGSIYLYVGDPGGSSTAPDAGRSAAVSSSVGGTVGPLMPVPPDCAGTSSTTSCQISYGPSSAPIPDPLRSTDVMTVTLAHTHSLLFGALGNEINIQARSSMRIEPSTVISGTGP